MTVAEACQSLATAWALMLRSVPDVLCPTGLAGHVGFAHEISFGGGHGRLLARRSVARRGSLWRIRYANDSEPLTTCGEANAPASAQPKQCALRCKKDATRVLPARRQLPHRCVSVHYERSCRTDIRGALCVLDVAEIDLSFSATA